MADFEVAWRLQERRRQGLDLPTCRSPLLIQYVEVAQFGTQTQRLLWLKHLIRRPPPLLRQTYVGLKRTIGAKPLESIKREVVTRNSLKAPRPPRAPAFRAELVEAFRGEVALLSDLLGRDLSHWR